MVDTARSESAIKTLFESTGLGTIDGQDLRDFAETLFRSVPINVKQYGAVGDGTTNDSQAFQDAVDALGSRGGRLFIPKGLYRVSGVEIPVAVQVEGEVGTGTTLGSVLQMPDGANESIFVSHSDMLATDYWHFTSFKNLNFRGDDTSTLGCGIEANCRTGEGWVVENCIFVNLPEAGVRCNRGGKPLYLHDVHAFGCGTYGIDLQRTGSDLFHMVHLDVISGDNNETALIRLKGIAGADETVYISNVKSEIIMADRQQATIELDAVAIPVAIKHLAVFSTVAVNTVVKVKSGNARLDLEYIRVGSLVTNLIDDDAAEITVAASSTPSYAVRKLVYDAALNQFAGVRDWLQIDTGGLRLGSISNARLVYINSATATLDLGSPSSLSAGDTADLTITVDNASVGDSVSASPNTTLEAGLIVAGAWVSAKDTVTVRIANITSNPIEVTPRSWRATVHRFW